MVPLCSPGASLRLQMSPVTTCSKSSLENLQPTCSCFWSLCSANKTSQHHTTGHLPEKALRGFLKLSNTSPVPALYFLLGELPAEAIIHINTLVTFHKMCSSNSTTWSNHLQLLCLKYDLSSPLSLLQSAAPWSKDSWTCLVKTKVTIWYENDLRRRSLRNSKMIYLNVQLCGLSGAPHPALRNIRTTQDVKKLRLHLKFLTCDFLTNERLSLDQPSLSPACDLCQAPVDSIEHVLAVCRATQDVRSRLLPDLLNTVARVQPSCSLLHNTASAGILTQFVLDCTSLNLPDSFRIPAHNPDISAVFKLSSDFCFSISSERSHLLKLLVN